jgi:hypothetical protein
VDYSQNKTAADQNLERSITTQPLAIQPLPLPTINGVNAESYAMQHAKWTMELLSMKKAVV